jgi:hypothetical protein
MGISKATATPGSMHQRQKQMQKRALSTINAHNAH